MQKIVDSADWLHLLVSPSPRSTQIVPASLENRKDLFGRVTGLVCRYPATSVRIHTTTAEVGVVAKYLTIVLLLLLWLKAFIRCARTGLYTVGCFQPITFADGYTDNYG